MVTSGFYDSQNHDRKYNSRQFGSIFDGVIRDGIFMSVGTAFRVVPGEGMMVIVGIGRAWFNHTWLLNDALLPLTLPQSELLLNRIDAIVLDFDATTAIRKNDIKIIKGTPSKTPQRPTLINNTEHHQYPLAYIAVNAGVTAIRAADITSMIGTSASPYVTGILSVISNDAILAQWTDQWNIFYDAQTADIEATNAFWKLEWERWYEAQTAEVQEAFLAWKQQWDAWYASQTTEMTEANQYWRSLWAAWFYTYTNQSQNGLSVWIENIEADFIAWWESIKDMLNESCCANLTARVVELEKRTAELEEFQYNIIYNQMIQSIIYDTRYDGILGHLTNQDNVELTNHLGELFDVAVEISEPILDTEMDPLTATVRIAIQ